MLRLRSSCIFLPDVSVISFLHDDYCLQLQIPRLYKFLWKKNANFKFFKKFSNAK